jgi:ABC-type sulfate transport system permease component
VNSVLLAAMAPTSTASMGAISAWLVAACAFRGRALLEVALLLPLAMPAYVCGYAYVWLLDVAGPVQSALRDVTGLTWGQYWFPEIRSLPGAALMLASVLYPYVYLLCRGAFLTQSVCLLEASRTLGHGLPRTFLHVALPMARPALAGGVALALMETLADYGTVQHFAVRTFTTGIYDAWFGLADRPAAAQLAACLMGLVALLLVLERLTRGGRRYHPMTTRHPPLRPVQLHGWKAAAAFVACAMPVLLGFVVPAVTLLALMLQQVLLRHRLARQAEQPGLGRPWPVQQGVVQAAQEGLDEGARLGRPGGDHPRRGAAEAEDAQRVVDVCGEGPGDLGQAPLRDQPQQHHLRRAEVPMHQAEGDGQVLIRLGGDPGDHVVVPADLDRSRDRRACHGQRGQAPLHRRLPRCQRGAAGCHSQQREQQRAQEPSPKRHRRSRRGCAGDGARPPNVQGG